MAPDEAGVGQAGQVDEADAVREVRERPGRSLQRETGLADAADAGQRHETCIAEVALDLGQLHLTADEARHRDRQIVSLVGRQDDGGTSCRRIACSSALELRARLEAELVVQDAARRR